MIVRAGFTGNYAEVPQGTNSVRFFENNKQFKILFFDSREAARKAAVEYVSHLVCKKQPIK